MISDYYIPDNIIVGYRKNILDKRPRLAFLTYKDELGKLKFEVSWNNWRDKKIQEDYFKNDIIKSLKIVSTAGGYKSGWNYRQEYIRLEDERGFMFEITTDNFIWCLDYCVCDHGILKGGFALSWESNSLVLLPIESETYKAAKEYSEQRQNKRITKISEMTPGKYYQLKNMSEYKDDNFCKERIFKFLFIGSLPTIQSDLSTKSRLVFICHNKKQFFFTDIKNVEFEINKESEDVSEYIKQFEHSPYSARFWKEYRFNIELISSDEELRMNTWRLSPFNTFIDSNGELWTYKFENEDLKGKTNWYVYGFQYDFNKYTHKYIQYGNIKGDFKIPLKVVNENQFSFYSKQIDPYNLYKSFITAYVKPKFKDKIDKWFEFENSHTSTDKRERENYDCIVDGYKYPLSKFLIDGFLFGYEGEFSVNHKYTLAEKI